MATQNVKSGVVCHCTDIALFDDDDDDDNNNNRIYNAPVPSIPRRIRFPSSLLSTMSLTCTVFSDDAIAISPRSLASENLGFCTIVWRCFRDFSLVILIQHRLVKDRQIDHISS